MNASGSGQSGDRLKVKRGLQVPYSEFTFQYTGSSGPGGQKVNKTATKVQLRWPVAESPSLSERVRERFLQKYRRRITAEGELVLSSQRYRDRKRNVDDCLEKLRAMLAEAATPPKPRKKTRRPRGAEERRLAEKRRRAQKKTRRRSPPPEE